MTGKGGGLLPLGISPLRVDLPDPPRIPVTRHSNQDLEMKSPKLKFARIKSFRVFHFCLQNITVGWNASRIVNGMNKGKNLRYALYALRSAI